MDPVKLKRTTLQAVPVEKTFFICRGDSIRKIDDLANCIKSLSTEEFEHHVDDDFDHFSDWIRETLKNPNLADDLLFPANKKDKNHYVMTIEHHVEWLQSVPTPKKKKAKKTAKKSKKK